MNRGKAFIGYRGINNNGASFEVIGYGERILKRGEKLYTVRFDKSGYISCFCKRNILNGYIRDPYFPHIHGVGYLGMRSVKDTYTNNPDEKEYGLWEKMLSRCYNSNDKSYSNYGGKGVRVCERWYSFENFFNDLPSIPGFNDWLMYPHVYRLDKDILQEGIPDDQKVYSPETCMFISKRDNALERHKRAANNPTGYSGVYNSPSGKYRVRVGKDSFGIFTNADAAANTYNRVAAFRGYPERFLNDVPYMTKRECDAYRDLYYLKNRKTMVYALEKVRHKTLTDKSEFKIMCKIVDKDKQRE